MAASSETGNKDVIFKASSSDAFLARECLSWSRNLLLTGTLGTLTLGFDVPTPPTTHVPISPVDTPMAVAESKTHLSLRLQGPFLLSQFSDKLDKLSHLPDNWNGYGSHAPNQHARSWTSYALGRLCEYRLNPLDIVASPDGGVVIIFQDERGRYADIEILNAQVVLAGLDAPDMPEPKAFEANDMGNEFTDILRRIRDHFA